MGEGAEERTTLQGRGGGGVEAEEKKAVCGALRDPAGPAVKAHWTAALKGSSWNHPIQTPQG